jgi:hypothetical protein
MKQLLAHSVYKISRSCVDRLIFHVLLCRAVYLAWCNPTASSIKFRADLRKSATQTLSVIRQAFGEESMSCTRMIEWQTETGETGEEQSQEHAHNVSLTSRGLFINNSSWQAKQSIPHTTVMFYGDCVRMCKDFAPNFDNITTTHGLILSSSLGNF